MHLSKVNIILIALILIIAGGLAGGYFYTKNVFAPSAPIPSPPVVVSTQNQPAVNEGGIKKFKDYAELKTFLEKHIVSSSAYYGGMSFLRKSAVPIMESVGATPGALGAPTGDAGKGGDADYSKTNIQVSGVDEADIVKTDGQYIYALAQNAVYIISALPADKSEIVSEIKFASSSPAGFFINGDRLVVYGSDWNTPVVNRAIAKSPSMFPIRAQQLTFLKVYDTADKKNPVLKRDLSFEGYYSNSRMIGDWIYFVTSKQQYDYFDDVFPLPYILENGAPINTAKEVTVYYFDVPYRSQNFVTVASVNITDASQPPASEVYLLDGDQQMYVSQNNMYITYTRYIDEYQLSMETAKELALPRISAKERERIQKIEEADSAVLSEGEKSQKIMSVIQRYIESLNEEKQKVFTQELRDKMKQKYEDISKELEKTIIHKIAISDGKISYQTMGEVTGHVLNQFSMDEDGGYFRIATTKSPSWPMFAGEDNVAQKSYNNLYVLDSNLKITGKVENLATDERIYSIRFMQGRAYIVTFKQTDPLFVIDVANPADPKVLGELKIPGFSNYLHPYDDTTLIGLGKESGALKISLFDVSDTTNPKETAHYTVEGQWSDSAALYDHKAFLFSKEKNLLVIPVTIQGDYKNPSSYFIGAFVFNIAKDAISLKGKITHSKNPTNFDYSAGINRSLYIENTLYTLSNEFLDINSLADLALIKNIAFNMETVGFLKSLPVPLPTQIME